MRKTGILILVQSEDLEGGNVLKICFSNGFVLNNPEERVREYCDIEIYQGYDDCHDITNKISWKDIQVADRLYANIMRFWRLAAEEMVKSSEIPVFLRRIENTDLGDIPDSEWSKVKSRFRELLRTLLNIRGVGLAVATKVLHLKRPKLIPILDSYVMRFLLGLDINQIPKTALLEYGMQAFEVARRDLSENRQAFNTLQNNLRDLPIPLENVRLYDILCWTTEKWDIRGETNAPFGTAHRSLRDQKLPELPAKKAIMKRSRYQEIKTVKQFETIRNRGEGFVVITDTANPNKIHTPDCRWVARKNFEEKVIVNRCKNGHYYWTDNIKLAAKRFKTNPCGYCKPTGGL